MESKRTTHLNYKSMYEYYSTQQVLPTYGHFKSAADLENHHQHRHELFTVKLQLPVQVFQGANLIEFGPDSGENSLVFAEWGANCVLVEPNLKAHPVIEGYFQQYDLTSHLVKLEASDVADYARQADSLQNYDVIDAEGFIYTVKPNSLWIDLFARLLNDNGFLILFYCEPFGSLIELITKVIYSGVKSKLNKSELEVASLLFLTKWDSIPHRRRMESWVMDVLENPFVRLRYFLEPQALLEEMYHAGFSLYSSWPSYKDGLDVHWFKTAESAAKKLHSQKEFVALSRLSHIFGRKHFLAQSDVKLEKALFELLAHVDSSIDALDAGRLAKAVDILEFISEVLDSDRVIANPSEVAETIAFIRVVQQIFTFLGRGMIDEVVNLCNSDQSFISTWGTPSHFAVFTIDRSNPTG